MASEEEYRVFAAETVELVQRTNSPNHKRRLLALAEAWLELAERAARTARARLRLASTVTDSGDRPSDPV